MPTKNEALKKALMNIDLATDTAKMALEEILKIDRMRSDDVVISQLREAILTHKEFWNKLGLSIDATTEWRFDGAAKSRGRRNPAREEYNFTTLFQLAAEKKITFALQNQDPQLLDAIINAADENKIREQFTSDLGEAAFGDFRTVFSHPAWNADTQEIITNEAAKRIREAAQKIQSEAQRLSNINSAKKSLPIFINNIRIEDILANGEGLNRLNDIALPSYLNYFTEAPADVQDNARLLTADEVKAQLGKRFLEAQFARGEIEAAVLETIATTTDFDLLKTQLHNIPTLEGNYIDHAVTNDTLADLKEAAAAQALKLKIESTTDVATLDALLAVNTPAELRAALTSNAVLQFTNKADFIATFRDSLKIEDIKIAALVQKNLLSATPTQMENLLNKEDFIKNYQSQFATLVPPNAPPILTEVGTYFADPKNVFKARQKALLHVAKAALAEKLAAADDNLRQNLTADTIDNLQYLGQILLGNNDADDLLDPKYADLSQTLRGLAVAEQVARQNKDLDLDDAADYDALLKSINLIFNNPETQKLIGLLSDKEKQALQTRLVAILVTQYPRTKENELVKLATAATMDDFANILAASPGLNVAKPHAWLTKDTMRDIQRRTCLTALSDKINELPELPGYTTEVRATTKTELIKLPLEVQQSLLAKPDIIAPLMAHPHLISLFAKLPVEKQKALISKPGVLNTLINAKGEEKINEALGIKPLVVKPASIPALIAAKTEEEVKKALADQAPLATPQVINELINANDEDAVKKAISDNSVETKSLMNELVKENAQLAIINTIFNAKVASILANIFPPVTLSADVRDEINKELLKTPPTPTLFADYAGRMAIIRDLIALKPEQVTLFNKAFGLSNDGSAIVDPNIKDEIVQQHDRNKVLIAYRGATTLSASDRAILDYFLPEKKLAPLILEQVQLLLSDFKSSATLEDFIAKIEPKASPARPRRPASPSLDPYAGIFDSSWKHRLTSQLFDELKQGIKTGKLSDPGAYKKALEDEQKILTEMDKIFSAIQDKDRDVRSKLKKLGDIDGIDWYDHTFQAAAKQRAHAMADDFRVLADACNAIVTQYEHQRKTIENQINALPDEKVLTDAAKVRIRTTVPAPTKEQKENILEETKTHINAIKTRRKELEKQLIQVSNGRDYYRRIQTKLNGDPGATDPLLKQGILKTIKEAEENQGDIRFKLLQTTIKDILYTKANWDAQFTSTPGASAGQQTTVSSGFAYKLYQLEEKGRVAADHFRQHSFSHASGTKTLDGGFLERRGATDTARYDAKTGITEYTPDITLTVSKFPDPSPHNTARIKFAMTMVSKFIAAQDKPSAKNRIILEGANTEELQYLFTALIIVGKNDPYLKFGREAIEVASTAYYPENDRAFLGYTPKRGYTLENEFMNNPEIKGILSGIQALNEAKYGNKKEHKKLEQNTRAVAGLFKNELKQTLQEVKTKNAKIEPDQPSLDPAPTKGP